MTNSPKDSVGYIPWWLLALVTFLFIIAAGVLTGFLVTTRPADLPIPTVTAIIVTAPSSTVISTPTLQSPPTTAPTETISPVEPSPLPPPAGSIQVGELVQVTGTGSDGILNLRAEPSTSSPVNYLAIEREVFQVQAGPQDGDGFTWWYLVDPATNTKSGWAVQNYLQVVQP